MAKSSSYSGKASASSSTPSASPLRFDEDSRRLLLGLARQSIESSFGPDPLKPLAELGRRRDELPAALCGNHACFVSLFAPGDRLRGCIGRLQTEDPLFEGVFHMARQAAFHDPRFPPLRREEAAGLEIHISVLGPPEPLTDFSKIVIGRHGLAVIFEGARGVLLADVARRLGWSREEFVAQTCVKAGLEPAKFPLYDWSYFEEIDFAEPRQP